MLRDRATTPPRPQPLLHKVVSRVTFLTWTNLLTKLEVVSTILGGWGERDEKDKTQCAKLFGLLSSW